MCTVTLKMTPKGFIVLLQKLLQSFSFSRSMIFNSKSMPRKSFLP